MARKTHFYKYLVMMAKKIVVHPTKDYGLTERPVYAIFSRRIRIYYAAAKEFARSAIWKSKSQPFCSQIVITLITNVRSPAKSSALQGTYIDI